MYAISSLPPGGHQALAITYAAGQTAHIHHLTHYQPPMMHVAKSLAVLSLVVAVAVAQIPGDRSGESQIDEEGFRSVTNSRESCDAHGNCVSDGSIPASELVEERSNQPWTRDEWKFANIKASQIAAAAIAC